MVVTSSARALLDRNFGEPVTHRPIDRRRRQRHVERHAVVLGRERFEIGADLVANVAVRGDAVGPHDREVDHAVLHQMAAGIVADHRMRHAVLAQLPGGERSALIARARLVDPDVDRQTAVMREIDRGRSGADIHGRQPAGIAMGEHVDAFARLLSRGDGFDQRQAVTADRLIDGDILVADFRSAAIGGGDALGSGRLRTAAIISSRAHLRLIAVGRVASNAA